MSIFQFYQAFWGNIRALYDNLLMFVWDGVRYYSHGSAFRDHDFVQQGLKHKWHFSDFLRKHKIREDLFIIDYPQPVCFAAGYNWKFTKHSHAGIFMSHGLFNLDNAAYGFLFKHEISHMKCHDVLMKSIVSGFSAFILAFLFSSLFQFPYSLVVILSIALLPICFDKIGALWMRFAEWRADRFAMKASSLEELRGAISYFSAVKKYNSLLSAHCPNYTSDGELLRALHYPKFSTRIERLKKEILRRTGYVYVPDEISINSHIDLLKKNDQIQASVIASLRG